LPKVSILCAKRQHSRVIQGTRTAQPADPEDLHPVNFRAIRVLGKEAMNDRRRHSLKFETVVPIVTILRGRLCTFVVPAQAEIQRHNVCIPTSAVMTVVLGRLPFDR
jgi:hypothetical protein